MRLEHLIALEIKENGPVSYCDFMDKCLYYPNLGYYSSTGTKIGKTGDYYTSPTTGTVFGYCIARQLMEMWKNLKVGPFVIVEFGAGGGKLSTDILTYAQRDKTFFDAIEYYIIEKNPISSYREENAVISNKVKRINSIHELQPFRGCILSNELVDNFPVHQVVMRKDLMEIFVDWQKKRFVEVERPASDEIKNYFKSLNINLLPNYRTEVNLQAINWIKDISQVLMQGYVLTFDYGYSSTELYAPHRSTGTLQCYRRHQSSGNSFENIGKQDITAHVNFSALAHWGNKNDLQFAGFTNQAFFLTSVGVSEILEELSRSQINVSGLGALMISLGRQVKALIQHKNMPEFPISGFRLPEYLDFPGSLNEFNRPGKEKSMSLI